MDCLSSLPSGTPGESVTSRPAILSWPRVPVALRCTAGLSSAVEYRSGRNATRVQSSSMPSSRGLAAGVSASCRCTGDAGDVGVRSGVEYRSGRNATRVQSSFVSCSGVVSGAIVALLALSTCRCIAPLDAPTGRGGSIEVRVLLPGATRLGANPEDQLPRSRRSACACARWCRNFRSMLISQVCSK